MTRSDPPSQWLFAFSRLRYEKDRLRVFCAHATGRCPQCRLRHGQHKSGCTRRPGRGARYTARLG